ncbi:MAG: glycosyltransferase [Sedimentisphaerales bacterium]|nr:glycosyltransferase [Sedimentisphaerales bacterium]
MKDVYVLVTAARNEEEHIERTIQSVLKQTIRPLKYVIVSDGSTDRTDEIAKQYAAEHDFIEYLRLESKVERDFACQVYGQHAGAELLRDYDYDFIGMLDGDISFEADYYERILTEFDRDPQLGLAGGLLLDLRDGEWVRQAVSMDWAVSGPVQLFRRKCFEDIGGYIPLEKGGQDGIAEVMARMNGWKVRTFPDVEVHHYRITGACCGSALGRQFQFGIKEYSYGTHPLFEIAKCFSRLSKEKPYVAGAFVRLCGYFWALLRRERRKVPDNVIRFLRREQLGRLCRALSGSHQKNPDACRSVCLIRHGRYPNDPRSRKQVEALVGEGYAVDVLCLKGEGDTFRETMDNFTIYRIPIRHRRASLLNYFFEYGCSFVMFSVMLVLFHLRRRYRCIHVATMPDALVFTTIVPKLLGAKVLLDLHEPTPELWQTKYGDRYRLLLNLQTKIEQAAIHYADATVTVTHELRERVIERGSRPEKVFIVSNVCDERIFSGEFESSSGKGEGLNLVTHGLIEARYGHEEMIRAVVRLRAQIPNLHLQILGAGEYEPQLFKLVEILKCGDLVAFAGYVPLEELIRRLRAADAGIIAMRRSPYSELIDTNKMYEYMALRTPVIISGLKPIVRQFDASCVKLFEPGDEEDLARCILELFHDPQRGREMADNAYRRFEQLRWGHEKEKYIRVVNDLVTNGRVTGCTEERIESINKPLEGGDSLSYESDLLEEDLDTVQQTACK